MIHVRKFGHLPVVCPQWSDTVGQAGRILTRMLHVRSVIRDDALKLTLDLGLYIIDGVRGFHFKSDCLASERINEDLRWHD